ELIASPSARSPIRPAFPLAAAGIVRHVGDAFRDETRPTNRLTPPGWTHMLRPASRLWWLPALTLTWLLTPHTAHAWGNSCGIPLKIDFVIRFDVATTSGSAVRPAAPWYTYFPADPHLTAQAGHNPYPNWPQQWP